MKHFLILLILLQFVTQTFDLDLSIVRGINLKNAMVYAAFLGIMIQIAVRGDFKLELPAIHACFLVLILYAILSYLLMVLVVKRPGYDPALAAINLKSVPIDFLIVFATFFYGVRTLEDSLAVTKAILVGMVFANLITVLDTSGLLGLNVIPVREGIEAGRVQGALGEANQYAAVIVLLLPATVAMLMMSKGLLRLFWLIGVLGSIAALLVTISRGGLVGLFIGTLAGSVLLRQFLQRGRIIKWAAISLAVLAISLAVLSVQYGALLYERLIVNTFLSDGLDATSGRNLIWADAVGVMAESPWTFVSGFGLSAYNFMPFNYATHNEYLGIWFDLGLPGILSFVLLHFLAISMGRRGALVAPPEIRPLMIGFVIGWIAVCVSIFFVDLLEPYIYVWAYMGVSMRTALCLLKDARGESPADEVAKTTGRIGQTVPVGWVARSGTKRSQAVAR